MTNKVFRTSIFDKYFKQYSKKFRSLPSEIRELEEKLIENPELGTNLGAGLYKIRLSSESKKKGKSGGFRVINYIVRENQTDCEINLLLLYDKSDIEDIPKSTLVQIVKDVFG